jgi:hypothetical protein
MLVWNTKYTAPDVSLKHRTYIAPDLGLQHKLHTAPDVCMKDRLYIAPDVILKHKIHCTRCYSETQNTLHHMLFWNTKYTAPDVILKHKSHTAPGVSLKHRPHTAPDVSLKHKSHTAPGVSLKHKPHTAADVSLKHKINTAPDVSLKHNMYCTRWLYETQTSYDTASHPRRPELSETSLWETQISQTQNTNIDICLKRETRFVSVVRLKHNTLQSYWVHRCPVYILTWINQTDKTACLTESNLKTLLNF